MGRAVGDGRLYWFLVDVVVHPDHQGRGLGRRIIDRLVAHPGVATAASVGVVADDEVVGFYRDAGFVVQESRFLRWMAGPGSP